MIKASIILLLLTISALAEESPKLPIRSAEQAIAYFREVRDSLKTSITAENFEYISTTSRSARVLIGNLIKPQDYQQTNRHNDDLFDKPQWRIFGTLDAVSGNKGDIWCIIYDTGFRSGLVVYLDAVTGKILYIRVAPEG